MVLVEGDYCTKVKQVCKRHWYDKSNKKKVCEKFSPKSECIGKRKKKRFCIDKYSWPNKKGTRPEVMNNFYQAQIKCAAVGKRICTESEWTFACEGPEMKPFPYGYVRDARICNGDHKWDHPSMRKMAKRNTKEIGRLWRGVPSGSQPKCVSDFGVYDLPANNDEVVSGESRKAKYNSVHTGGPWYKGVRNQCRPKIYSHDEGFYYYFLGFRCCAESDGQPSDPRTPKQRRKKVRFKNVERIAGFGVERTKKALELKRKGLCTCPAPTPEAAKILPRNRVLCKTLCGTTVGDNAKNGDDSTRMKPGSR
jgi:formylglycine-generating enzyme